MATELQSLRACASVTTSADASYEHEWAIECRAAELFQRDFPTGTMRRTLPQFRSSYPDPIGDTYRAQARAEMESTTTAQTATKESELDHISDLAEAFDLGEAAAADISLWRREMVDTAARAIALGATGAEIAAHSQGFFSAIWQPGTPAGWNVVRA